jgi:hypothetical protein
MLADISPYNPHITTITTDTTFVQQQNDPDLNIQGEWVPDQPYTYQRTAENGVFTDKLLVSPAQFRAFSAREGRLRRFSQLVFEVSYIDPESAPAAALQNTTPPRISNVSITLSQPGALRAAAVGGQILISASVKDAASAPSSLQVHAAYSNDGTNWHEVVLKFNPATGKFEARIDPPKQGQNIFVIVTATDQAGNTATYTAKGKLLSYSFVNLPVIQR